MKRISFVFLAVLFLLVGFNTFNAEPVNADYELIEIPSPSLADALINPRQTYKISVSTCKG